MNAQVPAKRLYRFGLFEADAESGKLLRGGVRVKLQDQPFRMLCLLLDHAGQVVTREELRQSLWSTDTYVEFDGSLNAALKRLRFALGDSAENPVFIETLPKRGYRFLAPVTVAESVATTLPAPEIREQESPSAKDGDSSSHAVPVAVEPPRAPWRSRMAYAATLAVLAVLGVASYHRLSSARDSANSVREALPRSVTPRRSVAIIGFNNTSGRVEDEWLSTALSEMISTELATGEKLRLVSAEDVANLRVSSPWSQTGTLTQATTARIGSALNSDVLVLGSYTNFGKAERSHLRLDVRLQDAKTGEILTEVAETGSNQDLLRVPSQVGIRLRERLGVAALAQTDEPGVLASLPQDREAARLYALGLTKLREWDALTAKDLLEQASKADPKFSLVHLMLARAWHALGYEQKRKEEAKKALDVSVDLPRSERMLVEGDYYESLADHEKAASTYRALFELFPDSVEYGLQLAGTQWMAGDRSQALETVAQLRRLPKPASDDPRIDIVEARILPTLSDSLTLLHSAVGKSSSQGKKLIYATARRDECMNIAWGEHLEVIPSCEEAYSIFMAAGNRLQAANSIRLMADSQGGGGYYERSLASYKRALIILKELGEHAVTGTVLNNMAVVLTNQGKLDAAEQMYRQARFHFEQSGDKNNVATALANIADILYIRGNLRAAAETYEQSIEVSSSLDSGEPGYAMHRLGDLELAQGRIKDARRHAQQAMDSRGQGAGPQGDGARNLMGQVLEAEADLSGAREQYKVALEYLKVTGAKLGVAGSQVVLAELAVEEGHPEQAEPLLRAAIAQFEKEKGDPDATNAYIVLSRALLMQGKLEEARKAIQRAAELGRTSPDPALKLPIAIQNVRIEIASAGHGAAAKTALAAARQQLHSVIATARKLGYYILECEARLALGELELKANPALGRSLLKEFADDAGSRGLQLISRKASDLAASGNVIAAAAN